ncbi:MAG: hypothetical protein ACLGHN_04810 [Bacteriovoracia bacterium]
MKTFLSVLMLLINMSVFAQDAVIAVGQAEQDKDKLVIDDPELTSLTSDQKRLTSEVMDILRNNFNFYRHKFNNVDYSDRGKNSFTNPAQSKWKEHGVSYFVASKAVGGINDKVELSVKVWSVLGEKEVLSSRYKISKDTLRSESHRIADAIYHSITGKPSIFTTKIFFVSDRTSKKNIEKELYIMDFDGRRVERLTHYDSVVISPNISPDNSRIIFSLIADKKQISKNKVRIIKNNDLKVFDVKTKKVSTLSDLPGINSGAIFSSNGENLYLTLSFGGNADIYEMNLATGKKRKITSHYADEVDPSINKDGSLMTFLSSRSGKAHIYTMDPSQTEKDVKRISFVGQFNATPRFSPDGKEIAFTSWVDGGFDLYRIGSDGNNLVRLTKNFGSIEEPAYSPDGEFIIFTSKKMKSKTKAVQDIYIMNREGEVLGQLTQDFGRCFSPQWTNL